MVAVLGQSIPFIAPTETDVTVLHVTVGGTTDMRADPTLSITLQGKADTREAALRYLTPGLTLPSPPAGAGDMVGPGARSPIAP